MCISFVKVVGEKALIYYILSHSVFKCEEYLLVLLINIHLRIFLCLWKSDAHTPSKHFDMELVFFTPIWHVCNVADE